MTEFVLVAVLLLTLLFGVLQVAIYVYARNVVQASAADGARFGASAGSDPDAGSARAASLISGGLSRSVSRGIVCRGRRTRDAVSRLATVDVRCRGRLAPMLIPLGASLAIDVTASSLQEMGP